MGCRRFRTGTFMQKGSDGGGSDPVRSMGLMSRSVSLKVLRKQLMSVSRWSNLTQRRGK